MSGTPKYNPKVQTPTSKPMKKSTFVTSLEIQRQERISSMQPNQNQLSFSSYLDFYPQQLKKNFHKGPLRKETTEKMLQTEDEIKRARSAKGHVPNKPAVEAIEKNIESQLNENVIRLKMEEMTFKYKLKISNLLKELNISSHEMNRFHNIVRIDDILNFLSEKVRETMVNSQLNEANINKKRFKQKDTLNEFEAELESLNKKLKDKQSSEKVLKVKVKELHIENQQFLDKLNLKEKDISLKVTEIYQLKANIKESQKSFDNLQSRHHLLEKQVQQCRGQLQSDSKDIITANKELREENAKLAEKIQENEEELLSLRDKQVTISQINTQLTQEVTRWRERFEDGSFGETDTKKSSDTNGRQTQIIGLPGKDMRKSTMSVGMNYFRTHERSNTTVVSNNNNLEFENMKLANKVQDLIKENKQLSRNLLNYASIKSRFESQLNNTSEGFSSKNTVELETQYKGKIEQVAEEWKNKLYDIVDKYEDDLEQVKKTLNTVTIEKEELEKKLKELAVEKYNLEKKVMGHEKEIYELLKMYKSTNKRYEDSVRESQGSETKSRKSSFSEIKEQKIESQCQQAPSEDMISLGSERKG